MIGFSRFIIYLLTLFPLYCFGSSNGYHQVTITSQISEFFSLVELSVANSFGNPIESIELSSMNFQIFHIDLLLSKLSQTCLEKRRTPPFLFYKKSPKNPKTCPNLHHNFGKFVSIQLYTHFYQLSFLEISGVIDQSPFKQELSLKNSVSVEWSYVFKPILIEEGRKFYDHFESQHLGRGLGFKIAPESQVSIGSVWRSGTHALLVSLEEITGEFIRTFPGDNKEEKGNEKLHPSFLFGELKNGKPMTTTAFISHSIEKIQGFSSVKRQVILVRSPIFSLDSYFHLTANDRDHSCKLTGNYMEDRLYFEFMEWKSVSASNIIEERKRLITTRNVPTVFLRYEDLLADPKATLLKALTFYSGVPAELVFEEKVEEYLEGKGLSSFYRSEKKTNEKQSKEAEILKLDKFPVEIVRLVAENTINIIEEFGYTQVYQERLGFPVTPSKKLNGLLPFELQNEETMEMMLKYKFNNRNMKHKLLEFEIKSERRFIYKFASPFPRKILTPFYENYPKKCA